MRNPFFYFMGFSVVGSSISQMTGNWSKSLAIMLLVLLTFDLITYLSSQWIGGTLNWNHYAKETLKKCMVVTIIVIAYFLDQLLSTEELLLNATLLFYITDEIFIVIHQVNKMGIPIPGPILKAVQYLKNLNEEADSKGK
ncbi:phage holin family protein [Peribacillus tepidiphilus]|uniref:phage holin family protein n=1 Tax=Peribacillus tepidiphilus TaxID=2652445 RepID=UPI001290F140|nr:phage holin family protein [Peribacillus tepidiphilus]